MTGRKKILAIVGSASNHSSNHKLVDLFTQLTRDYFEVMPAPDLKSLPHFDPELSVENPPPAVQALREQIETANGIIISTPEYVFSIPSGLKNAIEWCVATTVFTDKPLGIITASAHGQKGHDELQLIMKTVMTKFNADTTLLIQGIKGKIDQEGVIQDKQTMNEFLRFIESFKNLL